MVHVDVAKLPNPHPEGCPWHDFTEWAGAPNVKWCESTICSIISEPANTWSNVAYLVVAAWFFWVQKTAKTRLVRSFGPVAFAMGSFSLVYHASNNYPTQILDFIGMYLYVYLLLVINLRRLGLFSARGERPVFWALVVATTGVTHLMYLVQIPYQLLVLLAVIVILITEGVLYRRGDRERYGYRDFVISFVLITGALSASLLDVTRTWCNPENAFLHGHAVWHLGGAVSIFFAFRFYRQIEID